MIYVYHDADIDDVQVFDTLEKAKNYAQEQCKYDPGHDWYECRDGVWQDLNYQYAMIFAREVQ